VKKVVENKRSTAGTGCAVAGGPRGAFAYNGQLAQPKSTPQPTRRPFCESKSLVDGPHFFPRISNSQLILTSRAKFRFQEVKK